MNVKCNEVTCCTLRQSCLQELAKVKAFRSLDLGYNKLKSIPISLENFTNLIILFLNGNELTAIPEYAFFQSMTQFMVNVCISQSQGPEEPERASHSE